MRKQLYLSMILLACTFTIYGQESRSLSFLEYNPSTRAAGMGGTTMGDSSGMYIYTNPSAVFNNNSKYYTSYSYGMFPKINESRQSFHAVSTAYKLFNNHSIMLGFRYFSGLSIPSFDVNGVQKKDIKPNDLSIDIAYAIRLNDRFSAYIGGSFIKSYIGKTAYTGGASAGVYYNNSFKFINDKAKYNIGFALYDFGGKIKYAKGNSYNMPTSIGLGGSISMPFSKNHMINAALSTRYFLLPSSAASFTAGIGLEYELYKLISLRTGYHLDSNKGNDNNYYSIGLGLNIKCFAINVSYNINNNKDFNILSLGINLQL